MIRESFKDFRDQLKELGSTLPENLLVLRTTSSTNQVARDIVEALPAHAYPPERCFVVSFEQTRGRGRAGRSWVSPAGQGLYCSMVYPLAQHDAPAILALAVAVSLCSGIRQAGVVDCQLKWPNDLVVGRRKLGGILIEVIAPQPQAPGTSIIGFGINLWGDSERLETHGGTTMDALGASPTTAAELLAALAPRLRDLVHPDASKGEIVARYRQMVRHRAGDVLSCRQGDETIRGVFVEIDDSGHLVLDTSEGRRVLAVGDIIES